METTKPPEEAVSSTVSSDSGHVKHIQMQPVETSGGHDLAHDLVWQRDPDCTKDQVKTPVVPSAQGAVVTPALPVSQTHVLPKQNPGFSVPTGTPLHAQQQIRYQLNEFPGQPPIIPNPAGDNAVSTVVPSFQLSPAALYTSPQPPGVVGYIPQTAPQTMLVDTDGIRIQQLPQNMQFQRFPVQQNLLPVQFNPNFVAPRGPTQSSQFVNMPPPATTGQQYQRLIPICQVNPQYLNLPRTNIPILMKPTTLNVTAANQQNQSPSVVSPVTSPSVTSPGTESVKSPTYVFMCNKCSYVTPYRSSFKTHYSSHIQYKPYQCAYCDHSTIMKQPMQKHVKMRHGIEDAEGFSYETDSKKENIIDFFCKQCRSTMSMEEAKKYLAKYESQTSDKLKPGPLKRKVSVDNKEDESSTELKRKKHSISESSKEPKAATPTEEASEKPSVSPRGKSQISPRKLTQWKNEVSSNSTEVRPKGRPKKFKGNDETPGKGFRGRAAIKFPGFGRKKFSPTGGNFMKCPHCDYKSMSVAGIKKHCGWKHPAAKVQCSKCSFSTFIHEEMQRHETYDLCSVDSETYKSCIAKSPEKTVGRPRKSLSSSQSSSVKKTSDIVEENDGDDKNGDEDEAQLPCPHCDFVSTLFALKRHLFFYHKECDWKCKHCGYKSDSKKDVVRHSNKAHPNTQTNIVQTFADISNLLSEEDLQQEKESSQDKDIDENKIASKHKLMGQDYYMTGKKRLYLGKKRISISGQSSDEGKLSGIVVPGVEKKKRGRKKESKVNDQFSFVVRPKKLKIAKIGFSCVYCTYAAPLRHQLRLHCYEKHTKHPACLMEFSNSIMALEEQESFGRDWTEDRRSPVQEMKDDKANISIGSSSESTKGDDQEKINKPDASSEASESKMEIYQNTEVPKKAENQCDLGQNPSSEITEKDTNEQTTENIDEKVKMEEKKIEEKNSFQGESEQDKEVLSCMESILDNFGSKDGVTKPETETQDESKEILPNSCPKNGHKFANPFSNLIVQLNSTQLKVKDAFEGTLDDVDLYLEKFGVRTLNMDSLTPRQFAMFMKKFGSSLQQLTENQA